jgi:hypothetical protein
MGLAPSANGENPGKTAVAKVPVPIFSQPLRVPSAVYGTRSVPTTLELNNLFLRGLTTADKAGRGRRTRFGADDKIETRHHSGKDCFVETS